ncbi:hypothetical protein ACFL59_14630, partial [Planctomycetota bacterium]
PFARLGPQLPSSVLVPDGAGESIVANEDDADAMMLPPGLQAAKPGDAGYNTASLAIENARRFSAILSLRQAASPRNSPLND